MNDLNAFTGLVQMCIRDRAYLCVAQNLNLPFCLTIQRFFITGIRQEQAGSFAFPDVYKRQSLESKKQLAISRFALKDLPEPGVPKIRPFGFFSSFRSTMMRLLDRALMP